MLDRVSEAARLRLILRRQNFVPSQDAEVPLPAAPTAAARSHVDPVHPLEAFAELEVAEPDPSGPEARGS